MCWRGHGLEFHVKHPNGMFCNRCHMLRTRMRRSGRPIVRMPLFTLNVTLFNRIVRRLRWTALTVSILANVNPNTLRDYKRGIRTGRKRQPYRAARERAVRIARALGCDFSQLWSQA